MAYAVQNFPTKKALREAVADHDVPVYQPGGAFPLRPVNGRVAVEGPHYPQPHRWYADVAVERNAAGDWVIPAGSKVR